jgi:hypothetical protein
MVPKAFQSTAIHALTRRDNMDVMLGNAGIFETERIEVAKAGSARTEINSIRSKA